MFSCNHSLVLLGLRKISHTKKGGKKKARCTLKCISGICVERRGECRVHSPGLCAALQHVPTYLPTHTHHSSSLFLSNIFCSFFSIAMMTSLFLSNCDVTNSCLSFSNNILFLQPARAEVLLTPSKNIKNALSQPGQSFPHPLKQYFIPPAS